MEGRTVFSRQELAAVFATIVILLVIAFIFTIGEIAYRLILLSRVATRRRTLKMTGLFLLFLIEFLALAKIVL